MTIPPGSPPPVMDYEPLPQRENSGRTVGLVILGIIIGAVGIGAIGFVFGIASFETEHRPTAIIVLFFGLVIAGVIGAFASFSRGRRWFYMGLCLGAAVMSLVEGICFTNF